RLLARNREDVVAALRGKAFDEELRGGSMGHAVERISSGFSGPGPLPAPGLSGLRCLSADPLRVRDARLRRGRTPWILLRQGDSRLLAVKSLGISCAKATVAYPALGRR